MGTFPRSLLEAFRDALHEVGVRYLVANEPEEHELPVLLLIDSYDYIVADDFELEVPAFDHEDAWFQP